MTRPMHHGSPVWHPFTQHAVAPPPIEVVATDGAYLFSKGGRRIIDGISSWWVTTHGHRNPRIMAAIREATETLDQVIFAGFTHEPAEAVARALIAMAPGKLAHVFFSDSGSTAVEVAIKMALGTWANRGERRSRIIALEHAYHGDTVGTMSAGARGVYNAAYEPLLFDVARIPFPHEGRENLTLEVLDALLGEEPAAAVIVEPLVAGAGGMLMYGAETLRAIAALCRRHGTLLIADEVMTGFGRTGKAFACEVAGIEPDIMCVAKGLTGGVIPLAATLATAEIFDAHYSEDRTKTFFHSSSYTANPIACAAAAANLAIWNDEPVLDRIRRLVETQAARLAPFHGDDRFTGVRQVGTITALEVVTRDPGYLASIGPKLYAFLLERDVLLRPLGNTIYVMPPYCTAADDLDRVYDAIRDAAEALG